MKYFSLFSQKSVRRGKNKIIPAKEVEDLVNAQEIIEITKKDALAYRESIVKECELLREKAEREGFQRGLEKLYGQHLHLKELSEQLSVEVHQKILPLAIQAAKKILGEELKIHPDRIVAIILQALKPVVQHHKITIYVSPKDYPIVEKNKGIIRKILQQVETLKVEARDDVEVGGCLIETEAGIINAQLDNQWQALERAFEKFMEGPK
ncbi:MAG: FliH/SctL family protein [Chlamydiota bacterium]